MKPSGIFFWLLENFPLLFLSSSLLMSLYLLPLPNDHFQCPLLSFYILVCKMKYLLHYKRSAQIHSS